MNDLKLDGLTGKTIKEAEVDGFGIRMVFTDGAVFEYSASDGGYSQYELTEATAEAMQKQIDHIAESDRKVSIPCAHENDLIFRKMAIEALRKCQTYLFDERDPDKKIELRSAERAIEDLPSAQPDRKLIDDYMWKIKQNISPHTAAEGVIAIKYYLEQIYEQIYGEGEKPKWMT